MTTRTPYDSHIEAWRKEDPARGHEVVLDLEAQRDGYLRALADMQPRIDALLAALESLSKFIYGLGERKRVDGSDFLPDVVYLHSKELLEQARAALKLEGKE